MCFGQTSKSTAATKQKIKYISHCQEWKPGPPATESDVSPLDHQVNRNYPSESGMSPLDYQVNRNYR